MIFYVALNVSKQIASPGSSNAHESRVAGNRYPGFREIRYACSNKTLTTFFFVCGDDGIRKLKIRCDKINVRSQLSGSMMIM